MFIDKNSLQVKTPSMANYISLGQYILSAKFAPNKLWSDGGRNLQGRMVATLVGIFPKITVQFRRLTKDELEIIAPILDSSTQSLKYYDPDKKQILTIDTYTGDYEVENNKIVNNGSKNKGFSCAFIAISKRV